MILVINKKMVAAADKPGISGGYFSSENLQKYWECSGNKKGKPEIFGLPIHIFFEYLDCFFIER